MKVSLNLTKEQLAQLQALGLVPAAKAEPVKSAPVAAKASQSIVDGAKAALVAAGLATDSERLGSSWKVPCAYGTCDRTFDPNGIGRWIHKASGCAASAFFAKYGGEKVPETVKASVLEAAKAYAASLS